LQCSSSPTYNVRKWCGFCESSFIEKSNLASYSAVTKHAKACQKDDDEKKKGRTMENEGDEFQNGSR
jgi:hypothetical protein